MAFDHSHRRWFGTCSCKPVPRGLPSSVKQLHTSGPPRPFALVAHDRRRSGYIARRLPRRDQLTGNPNGTRRYWPAPVKWARLAADGASSRVHRHAGHREALRWCICPRAARRRTRDSPACGKCSESSRPEAREEILKVHPQHHLLADMWSGKRADGAASDKPVSGGMGRHPIQNPLKNAIRQKELNGAPESQARPARRRIQVPVRERTEPAPVPAERTSAARHELIENRLTGQEGPGRCADDGRMCHHAADTVSAITRPSLNVSMRGQLWATPRSWVTIKIVAPRRSCRSCINRSISAAV